MRSYEREYDKWLEEPYQEEDYEEERYEDSDEWDRDYESERDRWL